MLTRIASMEEGQLQVLAKKALFLKDRSCSKVIMDKFKLNKLSSKISSLEEQSDNDEENQDPSNRGRRGSADLDRLLLLINEEQTKTAPCIEQLPAVPRAQTTQSTPCSSNAKRPFSSYCSSIGDEDEVLPLSPGMLGEEVFLDTSSGYGSRIHTTSIPSINFSSNNSIVSYRSDSSNNCTITSNSTSVSWSRSSSVNTEVNNDTQEKLHKLPSEMCRRDKSLGLLGER